MYLPRGDYLVRQILIPSGVEVTGAGLGGFGADRTLAATMIRQRLTSGESNIAMIRFEGNVTDGSLNIGPVRIAHLVLRGDPGNATNRAIEFMAGDGTPGVIQDTVHLHDILTRGFRGGGWYIPKGARPLHIADCNFLFNGGYGIDYSGKDPASSGSGPFNLTQAIHFDNISGDGNILGLIRIRDADANGSFLFTNTKSEKRTNTGVPGNPAGQPNVYIFENCQDTPIKIDGTTHVSSVVSGATFEPPGAAIVIRGNGCPKLEWSGVAVRVRADDVAGAPYMIYDETKSAIVEIDQTSGRYYSGAGTSLWFYDERDDGGWDLLDSGQETFAVRRISSKGVGITSGTYRGTRMMARKSGTFTKLQMCVGSTAAGATPTVAGMFITKVNADGTETVIGVTANDAAMFGTTDAVVTRSTLAPFTMHRGQKYAIYEFVVTAATLPTFAGIASIAIGLTTQAGHLGTIVSGKSALPAVGDVLTVSDSSAQAWAAVLP